MTASLIAPVTQICAFALGCALIHGARAHAPILTRLLTGIATITGFIVLFAAVGARAPDDRARFDEITGYAAIAGPHPRGE